MSHGYTDQESAVAAVLTRVTRSGRPPSGFICGEVSVHDEATTDGDRRSPVQSADRMRARAGRTA